jgi:hypothetical protein
MRRANGHTADPARHSRPAGLEDQRHLLGDLGKAINNDASDVNLGTDSGSLP